MKQEAPHCQVPFPLQPWGGGQRGPNLVVDEGRLCQLERGPCFDPRNDVFYVITPHTDPLVRNTSLPLLRVCTRREESHHVGQCFAARAQGRAIRRGERRRALQHTQTVLPCRCAAISAADHRGSRDAIHRMRRMLAWAAAAGRAGDLERARLLVDCSSAAVGDLQFRRGPPW